MAETLILNRAEIEALVSPHEALEPMRDAFRLYSTQRTVPTLRVPPPLPPPAPPDAGAMILVPGIVAGIPAYTVKVHAKHPGRDPAIQGVIILSSLETGATLAILESGFLTALRTGLAGAIGAKVLARPDARTVAIVGGLARRGHPAIRRHLRVARLRPEKGADRIQAELHRAGAAAARRGIQGRF